MATAPQFMHERDREGLAMLYRAANEGLPCPTDAFFCNMLGFKSTGSPVNMMNRLKRKGLIRVQRFRNSRIVEITASGKKTATPADTSPHWRDRKGATK